MCRPFVFLSICIVVLWAAFSPAFAKGERLTEGTGTQTTIKAALLLGIVDYDKRVRLWRTETELRYLHQALEAGGYFVEGPQNNDVLLNPEPGKVISEINRFLDRYGRGPQNQRNELVIFVSGHGGVYGERAYLAGRNAGNEETAGFSANVVYLDSITSLLQDASARQIVMMFDSCFSGDLFQEKRQCLKRTEESNAPVQMFLTAGPRGQTVPERSALVRGFLEALSGRADKDSDERISGGEMYQYLTSVTPRYANNPELIPQCALQGVKDSEAGSVSFSVVEGIPTLPVDSHYWRESAAASKSRVNDIPIEILGDVDSGSIGLSAEGSVALLGASFPKGGIMLGGSHRAKLAAKLQYKSHPFAAFLGVDEGQNWSRLLAGSESSAVLKIGVASDQSMLFAGSFGNRMGPLARQARVTRLLPSGEVIWDRFANPDRLGRASAVIAGKNFAVVGGFTQITKAGHGPAWLSILNLANGQMYKGSLLDDFRAKKRVRRFHSIVDLALSPDNTFLSSRWNARETSGRPSYEGRVEFYGKDRLPQKRISLETDSVNGMGAIATAPDGTIFVGGMKRYANWFGSYSKGGGTLWERCYDLGPYADQIHDIAYRQGVGLFATGSTTYRGSRGDVQVLRLDPTSGDVLWHRCFGSDAMESSRSITIGPDRSIMVTGWQNGQAAKNNGIAIRLNEHGKLVSLVTGKPTGKGAAQFLPSSCENPKYSICKKPAASNRAQRQTQKRSPAGRLSTKQQAKQSIEKGRRIVLAIADETGTTAGCIKALQKGEGEGCKNHFSSISNMHPEKVSVTYLEDYLKFQQDRQRTVSNWVEKMQGAVDQGDDAEMSRLLSQSPLMSPRQRK